MSAPVALLDAVVRDALDPSYAEAAERRRRGGTARPAGGSRWLLGPGLLVVVSVLIGLVVGSQHKTLPRIGAARSGLAVSAGERTRQLQALQNAEASLRNEVGALSLQQSRAASAMAATQRQSATLSTALALTPVTGPGVSVTVTDVNATGSATAGSRPQGQPAAGTGVVTDVGLQRLVNALWSSGAEAIAVGGVRLGSQSAIRTAGETILVNFQAVRSPYVIEAIGGKNLPGAFNSSTAVAELGAGPAGSHPDIAIAPAAALTLPAASAPTAGSGRPLGAGQHP